MERCMVPREAIEFQLRSKKSKASHIFTSIFQSESDSGITEKKAKPAWMICNNGVARRTGALNEAISRISNVSLEEANELIHIGAVWARFDPEETYEKGLNEWGYASAQSGFQNYQGSPEIEDEDIDLENYIAQLEYDSRYERLMEPQIVNAGTDLRIYPHPRRFPSCYEINQERLLYEDTTFIVVDKPPMLPTQPDASNYQECCPGCVNSLLGPFKSLDGQEVQRPLLCHRVDSCVGGCVVLSKDKNGQKVFSEYQVRIPEYFSLFLLLKDDSISSLLLIIFYSVNDN